MRLLKALLFGLGIICALAIFNLLLYILSYGVHIATGWSEDISLILATAGVIFVGVIAVTYYYYSD